MPITPTEKIWMNGGARRLGRRQRPRPHPHAHYGTRRVRNVGPTRPTDGPYGVPARTDHIDACSARQDLRDGHPVHRGRAGASHPGTLVRVSGLELLLHPPDRLPRLRRDGPQPLPCPVERVAIAPAWPVGRLPRRRGPQGQVRIKTSSWSATTQQPCRRRRDHRHVHQLHLAGGGRQGRATTRPSSMPTGVRERVHRRERVHGPRRPVPHPPLSPAPSRASRDSVMASPPTSASTTWRWPATSAYVYLADEMFLGHRRRGLGGQLCGRPPIWASPDR